MKRLTARTVVVGSGCAGLNAADWLHDLGDRDFLLLTEGMKMGTSRNTGSDKQTYYKLSLAGGAPDSIEAMARDLCADDVNGDTALCEAAGSVPSFFKLIHLGVPFPCNEFGEYAGYQTDHDLRGRATSAGPLTSRYMTEALEKTVLEKGVRILDGQMAFYVETGADGVCALWCADIHSGEITRIACAHVVMCTGGPAAVYQDRVYPASQHGMTSLALTAGAAGANLLEWQYGLASVGFRWNVSGSYQQVLPRYVSVDPDGTEREFLLNTLSPQEAMRLCFRKGYEWPYDEQKAEESSIIDILTKRETDAGRRVYLDYTRNPAGFTAQALSSEAADYLRRSDALLETPLLRLLALNPLAFGLYRNNGIDLGREKLEIKVCAQHHNGGIAVDVNWQTCVPGLYVCGEAAGTFGARRPGGAALNSTQVGSMRAAAHIARVSRRRIAEGEKALDLQLPRGNTVALMRYAQAEMSRVAAFRRDEAGMQALFAWGKARLSDSEAVTGDGVSLERLRLRDVLFTQQSVLSAMIFALRDRGPGVVETKDCVSRRIPARPLPVRDLWFENVWRAYRNADSFHTSAVWSDPS